MNTFIAGFLVGLLVVPVISGIIFALLVVSSEPEPDDFKETAERYDH